jgi:hypothetical protein
MRLLAWKKIVRGTLRGFADVEIDVGHGRLLTIFECPVHVGNNGHRRVNLPGKPEFDKETDKIRRNAVTGKIIYTPFAHWPDRETSDQFSRAVVKYLLDRDPAAFDAEMIP